MSAGHISRRAFLGGVVLLASGPARASIPPATITSTPCPSLPFVGWHNVVADPANPSRYLWTLGGEISGGGVRGDCYKIDLLTASVVDSFVLPYWTGHASAVEVGGKVVVIGGMGYVGATFSPLKVAQLVDLATKTSTHLDIFDAGYDVEAVAVGGSALYFGGHGWDGSTSWSRWEAGRLDVVSGALQHNPFANGIAVQRVYSPAHAISATEAVLIGGFEYTRILSRARNLDAIEIVSLSGARRVLSARLGTSRRYHVSRKFGGKIVVAGGTTSQAPGRPPATAKLEIIDIASETVTPMPDLLVPRYHAHTAIVSYAGADYLLLVGGQSAPGVPATDVELYDLATGASSIIGSTPPTLDHDRISVVNGTDMVIVGGSDCGTMPESLTNRIIRIAFPPGAVLSRA
jgi:hypothetical protein